MPLDDQDQDFMREALRLAKRGYGTTSPNPMVGSVLVRRGRIIGRGWHTRAGQAHAEIEALQDARRRGFSPKGATLFVTLEPCSTYGRTPPCTEAIVAAGIKELVAGTIDPNPRHAGRGLRILQQAGVKVRQGVLAEDCRLLNEAFEFWIQHRRPFVTVKAAMTLDGKIASKTGESKWITGEAARSHGMKLRQGSDAVLVGINTVLADDPSLTFRGATRGGQTHRLRRIILDCQARTPLDAKVVTDAARDLTTVVVGTKAPESRRRALAGRVRVLVAPSSSGRIHLPWLLRTLGSEEVTSLLVEGGGEVNASFLLGGFAQRVAFFYAPKIIGGEKAFKAVAGSGVKRLEDALQLTQVHWRKLGTDLLLTARITT